MIKDRSGYALVLVIALIALGIFAVLAFLDVTAVETREMGARRRALKAFWYAEAGLNKGQWYIVTPPAQGGKGVDYDTSKEPGGKLTETILPGTEDEGTYAIKIEKSKLERTITSWGTYQGLTREVQQQFRVVFGTFSSLLFTTGNSIKLRPFCGSEDNADHCCKLVLTDSYDSRKGDYDEAAAGANGDIGTNSTASKTIKLTTTENEDVGDNAKTPKVKIRGDVFIGPNGNVDTAIQTSGNITIEGVKAALPSAKDLPPVEIPTGIPDSGNLSINSGATTLAGGTYLYSEIEVKGSAVLKFSGPATIYVNGDLQIIKNDDGVSGTVEAFEKKPPNLVFFVKGNRDVRFGKLWGAIYAPESDVEIGNGSELFGAVVGKSISYQGKRQQVLLHYDEALAKAF